MAIRIIVSLIPVFLLLGMLLYLDSFKLVSKKVLFLCSFWGLVSAAISFFVNTHLVASLGMGFASYSCYVAPLVEESLKCALLWILIKRSKAGFLVDAAIYGFAVGAAFSLAENLFYLSVNASAGDNLAIWITRGFGTAVMHSGTMAIFGILCISAHNRQSNHLPASVFGLGLAILIHGVFNRFLVWPLLSTVLILFLVPGSMGLIFNLSEKSIRNWLELEFDSEAAMLRMIRKGSFAGTKTGAFLVSLKDHFPGEVVLDLYCFISLYLELSMKAKATMMLRENDIIPPPDPEIPGKIAELEALKKSIGRAGYLAIAPVLRMSRKDLWKLSLLEQI